MFGGLTRLLSCYFLFGVGAEALGGGDLGIIGSAVVALWINHAWKAQQHADARQQHREDVEADEALRLHVREQRAKPWGIKF